MEQNNVTEIQEQMLIENRFVWEDNDVREYTRRFFFSPLIIGLHVFLGFAALYMLYNYVITHNVLYLCYVVIVPILYILRFAQCRRRAHVAICQMREAYNGQREPITVRVHEEGIILVGKSGESVRLPWYDLKSKVYETKHLLLIKTKGYHLVAFKKDAYTLGDEEDLKDLLAAKGFKVK